MPKTHEDIILETEKELLEALIGNNKEHLLKVIHSDIVYTNENGETFFGVKSLQINNPQILRIYSIHVLERQICRFNNIAIVNTLEKREGKYLGLIFQASYRLTRTWKFYGKRWMLIATSTVLIYNE